MSDDKVPAAPSRRQFLAGMGAAGAGMVAASVGGVGALSALSGRADAEVLPAAARRIPGSPATPNLFGRMFPSLPPFAEATDVVRAALMAVGAPGGILDANDDLLAGPKN